MAGGAQWQCHMEWRPRGMHLVSVLVGTGIGFGFGIRFGSRNFGNNSFPFVVMEAVAVFVFGQVTWSSKCSPTQFERAKPCLKETNSNAMHHQPMDRSRGDPQHYL